MSSCHNPTADNPQVLRRLHVKRNPVDRPHNSLLRTVGYTQVADFEECHDLNLLTLLPPQSRKQNFFIAPANEKTGHYSEHNAHARWNEPVECAA
jgi:hypothetical protein